MANNKNAIIRYEALDRCLSNRYRRFYIEDLIDACNKALYEYNDRSHKGREQVKRRQVLADLAYMKSEIGFSAPIESKRDGHRAYYFYTDPNYTYRDRPLKQDEIDKLYEALVLFRRFKGVPQFDWLRDMEERLYTTSQLGDNTDSVVSFQHNEYLGGMEFFQILFQSIINHRVVEITYRPFRRPERTWVVSPYYLKQYNNRWFLIAKRQDFDRLSNIALDRIVNVKETSKAYEPTDEDFTDYFCDVVGVSVSDKPAQKVVLRVEDKTVGYIQTKPLHESQVPRMQHLPDGRWEVTLNAVQDNYELRSLLLSFGSEIEVVEPISLRDEMRQIVEDMSKRYSQE